MQASFIARNCVQRNVLLSRSARSIPSAVSHTNRSFSFHVENNSNSGSSIESNGVASLLMRRFSPTNSSSTTSNFLSDLFARLFSSSNTPPRGFEHFPDLNSDKSSKHSNPKDNNSGGSNGSQPEPNNSGDQDPKKKDDKDDKQSSEDSTDKASEKKDDKASDASSASEKVESAKSSADERKKKNEDEEDQREPDKDEGKPLFGRRSSSSASFQVRFRMKSKGGASAGGDGNKDKDDKDDKDDKKDDDDDKHLKNVFKMFGFGAAGMVFLGLYWDSAYHLNLGQEIDTTKFLDLIAHDKVERVLVVNKKHAKVFMRDANRSSVSTSAVSGTPGVVSSDALADKPSTFYVSIGSSDGFETKLDTFQRDMNMDPRDFVPISYADRTSNMTSVLNVLSVFAVPAALIGVMMLSSRMSGGMSGGMGGRMANIGKSGATMSKGGKEKTRFADVAGLDEAKVEVMEFVQFLKNPERFTRLGAKIPKGALLVGPPGTGKTLLAKAVAGESHVPFFSISGSDFIEMFVGVGPSRVRDLFKEARKHAPCIVFIDEIDAVGRARGKGGLGGNDERENTLNQMLVEMDGFSSREGVVVLAGTNRVDILDKALLRPGRFDRQIFVDRPDINGRKQIFMIHLKNLKLKDEATKIAERMASLTPGMVGADIANVCNEAAIVAARQEKESVELVDFEKAIDRVIGGLEKKNKVMTDEEKRIIAHHEAGHAVAGWFLEHADPLLKVTIIPRSQALGFAQYLPKELHLYNKDQFLDKMCMALAGRAAEQVFFNKISTGASDDLKKVSQMAYSQVTIYGFNERLGHVSFQEDRENSFTKPFSEETSSLIDQEVRKLVQFCYDRTIALIELRKTEVSKLAELLLSKETLNVDDVVRLIGRRPFVYQGVPGAEYLKDSHAEETSSEPKESDKSDDTPRAAPQPAL